MPDNSDYVMEEGLRMAFADSRIPDFKKVSNLPYIPFGTGNDYPAYMEMLYRKSSKHAAIINNKCVYIMGNGFDETDPNVKAFLAQANPKRSWAAVVKLMCKDIEKKGGFYLEIIPKKSGGYNVYNLTYDRVRTNENNSKFWYKKDWSKLWDRRDMIEYPAFFEGITVKSIYYYKEDEGNAYSLPGWVAACNWIESDIEVSKCTLTNAKTGFSASKFINFYNGEPDEIKKKSIDKRLKNAATGSEGTKLLIGFNSDPAKKPTVDDLGVSDLTKEDFSKVNDLITNNIYAGHCVTHPLLFGIQQEGKLGSSQELKIAFDIFKNTYANAKQISLENVVKRFATIANVTGEFKLQDIEPIGLEFNDLILSEVAPRSWVLEKMGIDPLKYPDSPAINKEKVLPVSPENTAHAPGVPGSGPVANSILTNLTGKQHQQISRIVRQYGQGKLNYDQAALLLKNGFQFTDEDVKAYLGIGDDHFTEQFDEVDVSLMFSEVGEGRTDYHVIRSEAYVGEDDGFRLAFDAAAALTELQKKIVAALKKDSKLTNEDLANSFGVEVAQIEAATAELVRNKVIEAATADGVRKILVKLPSLTALPSVTIRYSYEKRAIAVGPPIIPTTRPFCRKLIELDKFYTREDIQNISARLGYSVFKRAGGFWNNNGEVDIQCRHEWRQNVVIKKS